MKHKGRRELERVEGEREGRKRRKKEGGKGKGEERKKKGERNETDWN